MSTSLALLFAQKTWSDTELLDALDALAAAPPTLPGVDVAAALHAATRTFNHIHVVDRIFQAHWIGQPHGFAATNTAETPTLAELRGQVLAVDRWYEDQAARLSPQQLSEAVSFQFTDGDSGRMSREEMLLHVITHGAYHRGNVGQVLKGLSVAPPRDLFTRYLHTTQPERRTPALGV
jgi:uncharacterized damage-inducible protein DinB